MNWRNLGLAFVGSVFVHGWTSALLLQFGYKPLAEWACGAAGLSLIGIVVCGINGAKRAEHEREHRNQLEAAERRHQMELEWRERSEKLRLEMAAKQAAERAEAEIAKAEAEVVRPRPVCEGCGK